MPFDPVCPGRIGVPDTKPPPFSSGPVICHSQARFHVDRRASPTCEGAALAASNSGSYVGCPCEGFALAPLSRQRQSMLGMRSSAERIPSSEAGGASPFMPRGVRDKVSTRYPGTSYREMDTCTSTHNLPSTEYSLRHWGCTRWDRGRQLVHVSRAGLGAGMFLKVPSSSNQLMLLGPSVDFHCPSRWLVDSMVLGLVRRTVKYLVLY